ncbi:hypothetical protein Nepgr_032947 [Nepenthes gracilis]|uniref:D-cysteine desulfhydrase n=1 Tax=Nepenthes gracilis TaxID=150966 RepID=A0AAD3TKZ1_NEPGR|nr:hypothetical protein Nepgr_032947 [Nepenthes gracilis]
MVNQVSSNMNVMMWMKSYLLVLNTVWVRLAESSAFGNSFIKLYPTFFRLIKSINLQCSTTEYWNTHCKLYEEVPLRACWPWIWHSMRLQHLPRNPITGATKSEFHSSNLLCASQGATKLKLCDGEFVSKLLDRRWTLGNPDSKIHRIMLSREQSQFGSRYLGNIYFSICTHPKLGDGMMEQRSKDLSFYIVRDDLLHPLVNGNKARKLDALLPIMEDYSGTDVVTCGGCQSAHAAAVAVSCAERGITSHLLLRGEEPEFLTGYNLVSTMYGNVIYVPRSLYVKREEMLMRHANMVAGANGSVSWLSDILDSSTFSMIEPNCVQNTDSSENHARKVVVVNEGAGDAVALLGVIRLVQYLSQNHVLGNRPYNFVVDAGTGTTAVGLGLGASCLGLPWKVTAVMLADTVDGYRKQEKRLISDFKRYCASDFIDHICDRSSNELVNWVDRVNPRKFGKVLDGEVKACQKVANQTGILVDPIYTLAAWELAALLSPREAEEGVKVVMIHTGGHLACLDWLKGTGLTSKLFKDRTPR